MKLNKEQVQELKADLAGGMSQPKAAEKYGVSRSTISDIATGRIWKKVDWPAATSHKHVGKQPGGQRKKKEWDPTNERVRELESEVMHLTDERNRERARAKASVKSEGLFKAVVEEMDRRIVPFSAPEPALPKLSKAAIQEDIVMHLSDGHHDQVVDPGECAGLENYNFQISCARAERYIDTVLEWTQDTLSPKFHFTDLWVLAYGDHTSGEIHGHAQRSYYRNQFKNCLAIGQLHALMLRDLSPYFGNVHVVYVPGNHGRRSQKKDFHGAHDNWDYLIAETARRYCSDLSNVDFFIPDAFSTNLLINGVGFNISHGDDVRGWSGIPFYGMVRRQKGLVALNAAKGDYRVRYFCMGHHHVSASLSDIDGELMVNGAWVGTDSYAYNTFSGYREPSQWIHGVNPVHGITWRLNVRLRHPNELKGPQRYKIDGGRDVGPLL